MSGMSVGRRVQFKIKTNCEEGKGPKSYSTLCSGIIVTSIWKATVKLAQSPTNFIIIPFIQTATFDHNFKIKKND